MGKIPVIVHHEVFKKRITADDKYYIDCILQAAKYNPEVVFLGNQDANVDALRGQCIFVDVNDINHDFFNELEKVYCDLATCYDNSIVFMKRFYLIYEYMKQQKIDEVVIIDSDVLLYKNCSNITAFCDCDVALCIDKNQHFSQFNDSEGLRWVANAGFSFWRRDALKKMLDFALDLYTNHFDLLEKKAKVHKQYNIPGGVTEMSVIYLWLMTEKTIRLFNMAPEYNGHCFNTNIWGKRNYESDDYQISKLTSFKKIKLVNEKPIFINKSGQKIIGYNIHFGGVAKKMMHSYRTKNKPGVKNTIYFTIRTIKNKIKTNWTRSSL